MPQFDTKKAVGLAVKLAERVNPLVSGPSAPLKTTALFDSFGPSLMPRATAHQGIAAGLSLLAAEAVGRGTDAIIARAVPGSSPVATQVGARAVAVAVGFGVSRIPESADESTQVASVRSAGRLLAAGAIGGIAHVLAKEIQSRYPAAGWVRPVLVGAGGFAGAAAYSGQLLEQRAATIDRWSEDDESASLPGSLALAFGIASAGRGLAHGYASSRSSMIAWFGEDRSHAALARTVNAGMWALGAVGAYAGLVGLIAKKNESIEPAYAEMPTSPNVSGGPNSVSPFDELGLQGRRFVTDVTTADVIERALGEPAVEEPIRAYIGYNSEPLYPSGRSELALEEMERLGAFERSNLLLFSPTGTGWVDQTVIESAEIFAKGDIATCCIQYGRSPSFLAVQKVALGRTQFRGLLWGVQQRLRAMDPEDRPNVFVFGESLGAWSSSDVVMHQGIEGFDAYGIDRALWFGLPGLAKWSKTGMREGSGALVEPGTVAAFDRIGELRELDDDDVDQLRAIVLDHDNDPIAQMSFRMAVKRPAWLAAETRGRGVPARMEWVPLISFVQVVIDAMNAMRVIPGQFKSFGHDYRGDTAEFVHAAYRFDAVTDEQMEQVTKVLLDLEVDRGERISQAKKTAEGDAPADIT